MQEVDDKFCRRGRLFFRDPVPAIPDDRIFDAIGDTPHHRAYHRAECSFATQGQDRHLKLALRKERPVVCRILAEREELGKARSHCAGLRIERRIMLALRLIKPLWVPGKFVPKTVEIDALTAGDQALSSGYEATRQYQTGFRHRETGLRPRLERSRECP